ncbi:MAG: hypothetical protein NWF14_06160 [Candidatus Bathyarchaeota archaeon]|nr:hypothetical protein [Candidatus Bathyarchaeota archaeon]
MSRSEEAKAENERRKEREPGVSLLDLAVNGLFILALTTGILLSYDYVRGSTTAGELLTSVKEILILYTIMGVALLSIYIARRRLRS